MHDIAEGECMGRRTTSRIANRILILCLCVILSQFPGFPGDRSGRDLSDMNRDGQVNGEDVALFQERFVSADLGEGTFSWCGWLEENGAAAQHSPYARLFDFIYEINNCEDWVEPADLTVVHAILYPTRIALGPSGEIYMTDNKVGSIFVLDPSESLSDPVAEYKLGFRPLCIAVDEEGSLYVGNADSGSVEKFTQSGTLVQVFGSGEIRMPSDAVLDREGNLYVADSRSNLVWVFRPTGQLLRTIRSGDMKFPSSVAIDYIGSGNGGTTSELYVADKDHYLVKVYDLAGNYLREFGGFPIKSGMMGTNWDWEGRFVSMADLTMEPTGNLLVLDNYMLNIQELNSLSGAFIRATGEAGSGLGQMKLPIDMLILPSGELLVADAGNRCLVLVEVLP